MKGIRAILSCFLAFLVLASSTTFQVSLHRCGGRVQNIALFEKAESCAAEMKMPPCHVAKKKSCCEDEHILHASDEFKAVSLLQFTPADAIFVEQPAVVLAEIVPAHISDTEWVAYDPPLRTVNRTLTLQTFLI